MDSPLTQDEMDKVVEATIRRNPGCPRRLIEKWVAIRFPVKTHWRLEIAFLIRRNKLLRRSLQKFTNKGRRNLHAWYES